MKNTKSYTSIPFTFERKVIADANRIGKKIPFIHAIMDADVTEVRKQIREVRRENKKALSLTAYLLYCFCATINENKSMHGCKSRNNKIIVFDEVDVFFSTETEQKSVKHKILHSANTKDTYSLEDDIQKAKKEEQVFDPAQRFFLRFPNFIKDIFYNFWMSRPVKRKKHFGTAYYSAMGMFSKGLSWGIPLPMHTIGMFVGNLDKKQVVENGILLEREFVAITISADHTIVDGAQLARFVNLLKHNISNQINTI